MSQKYNLLSLDDPTDEQLHMIMADALKEVKRAAGIAAKKSNELFEIEIERIKLLKKQRLQIN